uniref:Uncharacterized protein n=1 Tax=Timema monikensis TaxID=170555 RepID=A0A7R9E968_9NEOP|nr:unnamed protein product [Timema monikensis]
MSLAIPLQGTHLFFLLPDDELISRLHCESESFKMDLILDVNTWLYPMDLAHAQVEYRLPRAWSAAVTQPTAPVRAVMAKVIAKQPQCGPTRLDKSALPSPPPPPDLENMNGQNTLEENARPAEMS